MSRVANAIGIVKDVLEENHPDATVKAAESGECDFRVGSVGASVSVSSYGEYEVTEKDISDACDRAEKEISGRHFETEFGKGSTGIGDESVWFNLKS